jgi:kynurenine formamidase
MSRGDARVDSLAGMSEPSGGVGAPDARVSTREFELLFDSVSNWGRWGSDDERGALHLLSPERVTEAATLVREGRSVTLSLPVNTHRAAHNPVPADHHMTMLGDPEAASEHPVQFNKDYVGSDFHNDGHTHIDALCHVAYRGTMYNGRAEDAVTVQGAPVNAIDALQDGLVGRGVLLDIPRVRVVPWLEPGEHVFIDDLEAAEGAQRVRVRQGDILLVRTGHARRLAELGPWNTPDHKAGLHPTAMEFMAARGVAALGSDGNSDTAPSSTEGVDFPIHVLAIAAMGIHLLDYLQFEDLREACQRAGRWEFLFVAAPLLIVGGTGSPVNPLAVF